MYNLLKAIVVVFLPPLAVFMHSGLTISFWINVVLTLFGYIPGLIHGIFVMLTEESI
jgi:uncharacterized membrane protein YqaE (UPF0057 family)